MTSSPDPAATAPGPDVMDLENFVPALLTFISNRLMSSGSITYRRRFGIGAMEYRVLAMLAIEPGASGARIASVIGLDQAAVSRALRSLEDRGLVRASVGRGRRRSLEMTPNGRETYERAWQVSKERERRLLSALTAEEQTELRSLLRRLLAAMPQVAALADETDDD